MHELKKRSVKGREIHVLDFFGYKGNKSKLQAYIIITPLRIRIVPVFESVKRI